MAQDNAATAQELLDMGADFTHGVAYLDRKEVGHWANGVFYEEPGMEDVIAKHRERHKNEKAEILRNAKLASEAEKRTAKKGTDEAVVVPKKADTISAEEAATKQNSIPGTGPRNPVRVDGDNNRTPEVADSTDPVPTEDLLAALGNLEGADAVKQGAKEASGTGTELGKPRTK